MLGVYWAGVSENEQTAPPPPSGRFSGAWVSFAILVFGSFPVTPLRSILVPSSRALRSPFPTSSLSSLWAAYLGTAGLLLIVRGKLLFSVLALLEVTKSSHLFRLFYFVPRQDFDPLNILFGVKCVP